MTTIPYVLIVGHSGTGKTTLVERLIPLFAGRGLRVAAVKHDGHEFHMDQPGKDSWRFARAGAAVTSVASATHAVIMENRPLNFERLMERITDVDVILVEGFKRERGKKLLVCHGEPEEQLPLPLKECIAVVADRPCSYGVPAFLRDDVETIAEFLMERLDLKK